MVLESRAVVCWGRRKMIPLFSVLELLLEKGINLYLLCLKTLVKSI